jgi:hypothetical protein
MLNDMLGEEYSKLAESKSKYQQQLLLISALQQSHQKFLDEAHSIANVIETETGVHYETESSVGVEMDFSQDVSQ